MNYTEINGDLFTAPQGNYLAHCISADFSLGAGIAKKFDEVYNMRFKLFKRYEDGYDSLGEAILVDNVFNLVTKEKCYHKPEYKDLRYTLEMMKIQCVADDITKLAMPKIGCGLDGLDWDVVSDMIKDVFWDTDIDITVYVQ